MSGDHLDENAKAQFQTKIDLVSFGGADIFH